jgi:probable F420-dependent oxidoreductase
MKVDGIMMASALSSVGERARRMEAMGYDGLITAETQHNPFLPLTLAAEHTERLELATGIAVAFARNPMDLAHIGHDLQAFSQGRFVLGLGSQIKPHIEKRFSMPFSHPAARMRELILAMRAIWACWEEGAPLRFEGEFYRHTLMTPFFNPGPTGYGPPRVFLAAVGEKMTEVAG